MAADAVRLAGWRLPAVGLGTGLWGAGAAATRAQAAALVELVLSRPHPFFDTAPLYGQGVSETWLGEALRGVPRASYLLATKAGYTLQPGGAPVTDLSRAGIWRSVEGSLKRLGVDTLDIVHVHDPDCCQQQALDEAFPALYALRDQGVIQAVGAGMNQWEMLAVFARQAELDCLLLAGRYTLLEQTAAPLLDLCRERGIAVFLGGVYNSGVLATGAVPGALYNYAPAAPAILDRVRQLEAVCAAHSTPLAAAALQFARAHPAVRALIVGANRVTEFAGTLAALDFPIAPGLWQAFSDAGLIPSARWNLSGAAQGHGEH